mmetsp:Transcript_13929/g.26105  ORF Transcript_13929/g.26105 Transcript_13929/m.26105 type:complete len:218 (+) Transcript_13929:38-691(+)
MKIDILSVLSLFGAGMGVLLCLSPVPAFIKAHRTNSVKEISRSFIVVSNLMAMSWILYALKANIIDIFVPNVMQFTISLALIGTYFHLSGDSVLSLAKYFSALCIFFIAAVKVGNVESLGIIAIVFNTLSNLAPMDQVGLVIRERRADYLDMTVNTASFLYNIVWLSFGLVSNNHYVTLPNILGACCSLFLFGLYFWARSKACWTTRKGLDERTQLI